MEVNPLLPKISKTSNFIDQYLSACGIKNVNQYLKVDESVYDSPWDYPNMEKAVDRLEKAIRGKEKIGILCDSDCDGQLSAALITNYLRQFRCNTIIPYFHKSKAHGLRPNADENLVSQIIDRGVTLMIIPDASTADVREHNKLYRHGTDVLVIDHHDESSEGSKAIVVNHNHGNGLNTALSGTGVTEKVVMAHWEKYGHTKIPKPNYKDMVAVSLVSDVCDMTSLENRQYIVDGFNLIAHKFYGNRMIKLLASKLNRRGMTQVGFAWGAIPPINALCRSDNQEDKDVFFNALVDCDDDAIAEGLRVVRRAHRVQKDTVTKVEGKIGDSLDNNHKVVVGFTDSKYKTYIGLVANKLCSNSGKPALLLREKDKNTWSGSVRSPIPIKTLVNQSGLAIGQGHEEAYGLEVKKNKLDDLIAWFDTLDLDMNPPIKVAAILSPKDIILKLCHACIDNDNLWSGSDGGGIPQPKFYVEFKPKPNMVTIFRKKTNTIKFNFNNCDILKFSASEEECRMVESGKCKIGAIVKLDVNVWEGKETPQAKIEEWEIEPIQENKIDDWELLF